MICLAVSSQYRRVTDRWTDRQTDGQTDILRQHSPRYAYASRCKKTTEVSAEHVVQNVLQAFSVNEVETTNLQLYRV